MVFIGWIVNGLSWISWNWFSLDLDRWIFLDLGSLVSLRTWMFGFSGFGWLAFQDFWIVGFSGSLDWWFFGYRSGSSVWIGLFSFADTKM
jgi:hypothetical protein